MSPHAKERRLRREGSSGLRVGPRLSCTSPHLLPQPQMQPAPSLSLKIRHLLEPCDRCPNTSLSAQPQRAGIIFLPPGFPVCQMVALGPLLISVDSALRAGSLPCCFCLQRASPRSRCTLPLGCESYVLGTALLSLPCQCQCHCGEGPPLLENKAWFTVAMSPICLYVPLGFLCSSESLRKRSPLWVLGLRSGTTGWTHTCMFLVRVPWLPSGSWKAMNSSSEVS